jgi:hypothetical protein
VYEPRTPDRPQLQNIGRGRPGRKAINKQSKMIIGNVYKCFKNLADNPEATANINFGQVRKPISEVCGLCEKSVQRVRNVLNSVDSDDECIFDTPRDL